MAKQHRLPFQNSETKTSKQAKQVHLWTQTSIKEMEYQVDSLYYVTGFSAVKIQLFFVQ